MTPTNRTRRFFTGLACLFLVLVAGFGLANHWIPGWGSTPAERAQALPGDEIFAAPVVQWRHAITIDAAPEDVWPWIAQMGDTRGGFYSYYLVEKAVMALAGEDAAVYYNNANHIHPEWQNPAAGQGMIMADFVVRDVRPYQYLVAGPSPEQSEGGLQWTWYLSPAGDGRTRLLVHMNVQIPGMAGNKAIETAMNLATFMMERKMMEGIKLRAEGGAEAAWEQVAGLLAGLTVLGIGLAAARRFITRPGWKRPLAAGLAAVTALFVFVYLQPALWLMLVIVLALAALLVWDIRAETGYEPWQVRRSSPRSANPAPGAARR